MDTLIEILSDRASAYVTRYLCPVGLCEETGGIPIYEKYIQAIWFDATLRPDTFRLMDGRELTIIDPGQWNLEAGPDFTHAAIQIDGITYQGDIEIHTKPNDWDLHGHAPDPYYRHVILHVTWYTTPLAKTIHPAIPHLAFAPQLETATPYPFEAITLSDYPHHTLPEASPCADHFARNPQALIELLTSAGYYRLHQKTSRLKLRTEALADTPIQALYESFMAAMGYKQNSAPFRRLATELPYDKLTLQTPLETFAQLAGTAGLIPNTPTMRPLWDLWWQHSTHTPDTPYQWVTRNQRPQNHPLRRIAAAATLMKPLTELLNQTYDQPDWAKAIVNHLLDQDDQTIHDALQVKTAFIGKSRLQTLVNNVIAPYLILTNKLPVDNLLTLPQEEISSTQKEITQRLTANDPDLLAQIPATGLIQQGLLQIAADFCHNTRTLCNNCPIASF